MTKGSMANIWGKGRQRFSIAGLYSINLERDYMKQKAKHRPRCKGYRLIL